MSDEESETDAGTNSNNPKTPWRQVKDDYDSDIEELSQFSFNENFETKNDLSPIESAPVVDVFVDTTTKGKVRRKIRLKSVMDKNDPLRPLAVPTPSRSLQRRLNARSPVVSRTPRRHTDDVESSQRSLVSASRKGKAKVIHAAYDSDDGFAPISLPPRRLTSDDESSIPDSVEGFGEVLYCSEDDSRIAQQRPDEVGFGFDPVLDVGLDGDNDFDFDAGSDRDNDFDLDLDLDEDNDFGLDLDLAQKKTMIKYKNKTMLMALTNSILLGKTTSLKMTS
jgi:hypothetical protein